MGFPIRISALRGLVDGSTQLFAVTHVLHRFLVPRHPPLALCSLERTRFYLLVRLSRPKTARYLRTDPEGSANKDARACSAVLKEPYGRPGPHHRTAGDHVRARTHAGAEFEGRMAVYVKDESLKTEEKTVPDETRRTRRDRIPQPLLGCFDRRTSAPTGVCRTGPNVCRPSADRHSLERR